MLGSLQRLGRTPDDMGKSIGQELSALSEKCKRLDLPVTGQFLADFLVEAFAGMTDDQKRKAWEHLQATGEIRVMNVNINGERMISHVETIYRSFRAELSSLPLRVIPRERSQYVNETWLTDLPIYPSFPHAWKEFQAAGRCYAYGEGTACAFHLSRALEWGLKSLAVHLGKRFDRNCWQRHLRGY